MCKDCGCDHVHSDPAPGHHHDHEHPHDHDHGATGLTRRTVELERKVLAQNDEQAAINRAWLADHGVVAINLISSPGSGKTYLLERTLERLSLSLIHI